MQFSSYFQLKVVAKKFEGEVEVGVIMTDVTDPDEAYVSGTKRAREFIDDRDDLQIQFACYATGTISL